MSQLPVETPRPSRHHRARPRHGRRAREPERAPRAAPRVRRDRRGALRRTRCGIAPRTRSGSTATASCSRPVTARCSSTRGCTSAATPRSRSTRSSASGRWTRRRRATRSSRTRRAAWRRRRGPLGQGVANAVGMAIAAKMAEARFNTPEHTIFDHHVVCLAGDGCMQEGVAMEAIEFAGHQKLDNLILIYDSNAVTLDAMAKETQSEDTGEALRGHRLRRADGRRPRDGGVRDRVRAREEGRQRQAAAHHRQDAHRQGHPRGRRDAEGARRGGGQVRRGRAQGASACPPSPTSSRPR